MNLVRYLPRTALAVTALTLAACQQEKAPAPSPEGTGAASEATAPDAKPGLAVSDGVLILPAVRGRPAAAYFTLTNTGSQSASLAAVHIEGAGKAEMHETKGGAMQPLASLEVPAGQTARFERGGKHVMVFDLDDKLAAGGSTEMTLTFADGDKLSAPLALQSVSDTGGMSGMGHGEQH